MIHSETYNIRNAFFIKKNQIVTKSVIPFRKLIKKTEENLCL